MNEDKTRNQHETRSKSSDGGYFVLAIITLLSLSATFAIVDSALERSIKLSGFAGIVVVVLFLFWLIYKKQAAPKSPLEPINNESASKTDRVKSDPTFSADIENKLQTLEDANEFFGASLKSSDMFRLVASRINEMIPFSACALLLANEGKTGLKIKYAVGENAESLAGLEIPFDRGLAGKVFVGREPRSDNQLLLDKVVISQKALKGFETAIAVPLSHDSNVFGVLELFGNDEMALDATSVKLLTAISERFTPLFLSSTAFEKSVSSALTDSLTSLPNERAFFLVLENQIGESQRFRDERPLTVLTIDIKNFADINEKYGHAVGNDILSFSARLIKNGLRRMDFLARSASDEFLAVLPTASEQIGREVIERLEKTFEESKFEISPEFRFTIKLNFGSATFWKDGETPNQLLKTAYLRKQQTKSAHGSTVLLFPEK